MTKVPAETGKQVIDRLGPACGGVVLDRNDMMLFFITPGAAATWHLPGVRVFSRGDHVLIPADDRTEPPGHHWIHAVDREHRITDAKKLHAALRAVLAGWGH